MTSAITVSAPPHRAGATAGQAAVEESLERRLPELAQFLDNLAEPERREIEDAFLRVLALSARARPESIPDQITATTPEQAAAARAENLRRAAAVRRSLVTDSLSTPEVAELLGVTSAAVTKRRAKSDLVAFRHGGDWRYPRWQFEDGAVVTGVIDTWRALPSRADVGRVRWFTLPSRQLEDRSPLAAIDAGELPRVIDAASYVGSR